MIRHVSTGSPSLREDDDGVNCCTHHIVEVVTASSSPSCRDGPCRRTLSKFIHWPTVGRDFDVLMIEMTR